MRKRGGFSKRQKGVVTGIALGVAAALIGVPVIINCLFKLRAKNDFFAAEWTAGDMLSYYGAVLTFISTTILSVLALWQNHVIKEENDKHTALLERMEREKNNAHLMIRDAVSFKNAGNISLQLKNVSENMALNIILSDLSIEDEGGGVYWNSDQDYAVDYLKPMMGSRIDLKNPEIPSERCRVTFRINYRDVLGETHRCRAVGCLESGEGKLYFEIAEEYDHV